MSETSAWRNAALVAIAPQAGDDSVDDSEDVTHHADVGAVAIDDRRELLDVHVVAPPDAP